MSWKGWGRYLRNSPLVFAISMALGLLLPGPSRTTAALITPALILMMTFSLTEVSFRSRGDLKGSLIGFLLNYIFLSGLILALARLLVEGDLWKGFVIMAAVPPAVAVLPLTKLLGGDVRLALYSEALSYIAALAVMPGMILAFASVSGVGFWHAFWAALVLILVPMILSRFASGIKIDPVIPINLGFFTVTYTVIGLNHSSLFSGIGPVAAVALLRTFGSGILVYLASKLAGANPARSITYMLFASYKNLGLAAAVSLVIFGPQASVPSAVCIFAENLFYIFLAAALRKVR
jgi:BASS family bile acid:Na+ symporter